MKPYKQKRKDLELKLSRKPKTLKRVDWLKFTRQLAIEGFRFHDEDEPDSYKWEVYVQRLRNKQNTGLMCDFFELQPYFEIYKKCIKKLKEKEERAKFLKQNYQPLESDLFTI